MPTPEKNRVHSHSLSCQVLRQAASPIYRSSIKRSYPDAVNARILQVERRKNRTQEDI